jgi:hypothetical protein
MMQQAVEHMAMQQQHMCMQEPNTDAATEKVCDLQPAMQELAADERGRFAIYGPAAYIVVYNRTHNFFEICEAIWAHWMRMQQERPDIDPDQIFYWIDIFALAPEDLSKPLSDYAQHGHLEQVLRLRPASILK